MHRKTEYINHLCGLFPCDIFTISKDPISIMLWLWIAVHRFRRFKVTLKLSGTEEYAWVKQLQLSGFGAVILLGDLRKKPLNLHLDVPKFIAVVHLPFICWMVLMNTKAYLHFLSFEDFEMVQVVEILPQERQTTLCTKYLIQWLLMGTLGTPGT